MMLQDYERKQNLSNLQSNTTITIKASTEFNDDILEIKDEDSMLGQSKGVDSPCPYQNRTDYEQDSPNAVRIYTGQGSQSEAKI